MGLKGWGWRDDHWIKCSLFNIWRFICQLIKAFSPKWSNGGPWILMLFQLLNDNVSQLRWKRCDTQDPERPTVEFAVRQTRETRVTRLFNWRSEPQFNRVDSKAINDSMVVPQFSLYLLFTDHDVKKLLAYDIFKKSYGIKKVWRRDSNFSTASEKCQKIESGRGARMTLAGIRPLSRFNPFHPK